MGANAADDRVIDLERHHIRLDDDARRRRLLRRAVDIQRDARNQRAVRDSERRALRRRGHSNRRPDEQEPVDRDVGVLIEVDDDLRRERDGRTIAVGGAELDARALRRRDRRRYRCSGRCRRSRRRPTPSSAARPSAIFSGDAIVSTGERSSVEGLYAAIRAATHVGRETVVEADDRVARDRPRFRQSSAPAEAPAGRARGR